MTWSGNRALGDRKVEVADERLGYGSLRSTTEYFGLMHGDPLTDEPTLQVIVSTEPGPEPIELFQRESMRRGVSVELGEVEPFTLAIAIEGRRQPFEAIRAGGTWAARGTVGSVGVCVVGVGWPLEELQITRITDIGPYVAGSQALLRQLQATSRGIAHEQDAERRDGWTVVVDEPQALVIALFVRDIAALAPGLDLMIPHLYPVVPRSASVSRAAAASTQWARWWDELLRNEIDLAEPTCPNVGLGADQGELQRLVTSHFDDARQWSQDRKREFAHLLTQSGRSPVELDVVRQVERRLRRVAQPFHLRIMEIPVDGLHGWRLRRDRALISRALLVDVRAYRIWLEAVVMGVF